MSEWILIHVVFFPDFQTWETLVTWMLYCNVWCQCASSGGMWVAWCSSYLLPPLLSSTASPILLMQDAVADLTTSGLLSGTLFTLVLRWWLLIFITCWDLTAYNSFFWPSLLNYLGYACGSKTTSYCAHSKWLALVVPLIFWKTSRLDCDHLVEFLNVFFRWVTVFFTNELTFSSG